MPVLPEEPSGMDLIHEGFVWELPIGDVKSGGEQYHVHLGLAEVTARFYENCKGKTSQSLQKFLLISQKIPEDKIR